MTVSITLETRYILGLSGLEHNKALQRTRTSAGCLPWLSARAAELSRYAALVWLV